MREVMNKHTSELKSYFYMQDILPCGPFILYQAGLRTIFVMIYS